MKILSLSPNSTIVVWGFSEFSQTPLFVCFRGFICFKLQGRKQPGCILFMHHNDEALPLVYIAGVQGDFDVYQPVTFLPGSHHSVVLLHCGCSFSVYYHLWEWDLFINVPFRRQYSTIYLYVTFIPCQSVHLNYNVHMQTIWTLCCRIYCVFCTWWLICTPTSPAAPSQSIVWWFYVMLMWTYQMKEDVISTYSKYSINFLFFFTLCKGEH